MTWILISVYLSITNPHLPIQTRIHNEYPTLKECNKAATILYNNIQAGQRRVFCFYRRQA